MQINLYKSFSKRKNSTKQPATTPTTKNVTCKQPTSVTNPTFLLSGYDNAYNYLYVPVWGRYYFIDEVVLVHDDLFEIHCSTDVLATFKSWIGLYNCFVERTSDSTKYNTDLLDSALSSEDGSEVFASATTNLFGNNNGGCYVVRMVGTGATGVTTYVFNDINQLGILFNPMFDDYTPEDTLEALDEFVKFFICDPSKYLVGAYYSPLSYSYYSAVGASRKINIGWYDTQQSAVAIAQTTHNFNITIGKPSGIYSDFRRTDPRFSYYTLYLPAIGTIELSCDNVEADLHLYGSVDLLTGGIHYRLTANGSTIASYEGNCYVALALGSSSVSNGVSQIFSGISGVGVGLASENGLGAVAGGIKTLKGIGDVITGTPSVNGSAGGMASIKLDPNVIMSVCQKHSAEFPTSVVGRPCCKNLVLGTITGYIQCAGASIDITGFGNDKELVNNFLNNGFYYE